MPRGSPSAPGQHGAAARERQAAVLDYLRSRPGDALTLEDVYDRLKRIANRQLLGSAIGCLVRRGAVVVVYRGHGQSRTKTAWRAAEERAGEVG